MVKSEDSLTIDIDSVIQADRNGHNAFADIGKMVDEDGNVSLSAVDDVCRSLFGRGLSEIMKSGITLDGLLGENGIILREMRRVGFISDKKD